LLQISTFPADRFRPIDTFIIDVLASPIRNCLTNILGERVLENPEIVKILHGALSSDVVWLQRDFGIKICSVFDTQEFQKQFISQQKLSLANFWEQYCERFVLYTPKEKIDFQLADWSLRPLSDPQSSTKLNYAATDCYYLGHIATAQLSRVLAITDKEAIVTWLSNFNARVQDVMYHSRTDSFDSNESYRKPFRKFMDFFDPQSDEFLISELVYRDLFSLRETLAQRLDTNKKHIYHDDLIGVFARKRPVSH